MNAYIYPGLNDQDKLLHKFGISKFDTEYIICKTCEALGLSVEKLKSSYRGREYSEARSIIVGLSMSVDNKLTYTKLGKLLGNRDHSTIIYNRRLFDDLSQYDFDFKQKVIKVKQII